MPYASGVVLEPGESKTKDLKSPPRDATRLPETESGARCLYWIKTTRKSHKQTQEIKYFIRLKKSGGDDLNWVYRHLRGLEWRTDLLDL